MAEITTTQAFSDGDTVTATKLNNITANAAIQTEAITNRSAETTVDQANDLLLMYDASATALKKISLSNVIKAGTASNFPVTGNATIGGTLGVTGASTFSGTLGVTGVISAASTLELGHASDTTLSRGSAGRLQVEGVDVVTATSTDTLANKTLTSPTINTGAISGGTINNASLGATTPSTGAFTTLSATGDVSIADSIVHSGDNSKIRFPADDTVTIETAGSERVRVDSSGNVGIGDTTPEARLTVKSSTGPALVAEATNLSQLVLGYNNTSVNYYDADTHIFRDSPDTGNERLRIDSSGRVGIGTTSPSFLVDCIGSSTPTLRIDDGAASGTRTAGRLLLGAATTLGVAIENSVTNFNDVCAMVFKTTPAAGTLTERLRITSGGNVGIGTSNPSSLFHVNGVITHSAGTIGSNANGTRTIQSGGSPSGGSNGDIYYIY